MIDMGPITLKEAWEIGHKIDKDITKNLYMPPISLDFEKIFYPYLLLTKKNYAAPHYQKSYKYPDKINSKGIDTVRRDKAAFVRTSLKICLDFILNFKRTLKKSINDKFYKTVSHEPATLENGIKYAFNYLCQLVSDIRNNRLDFDQYIITTRYSKEVYKNPTPHSELVKKLKKRDNEAAPNLGERVKYVIISKGPLEKVCNMSEDPFYALENDLPINIDYYLKKKLVPPIQRLFGMVFTNKQMDQIFQGYNTKKIKRDLKNDKYQTTFTKSLKLSKRTKSKKIIKQQKTKRNKRSLKLSKTSKKRGTIGFFFKTKKKCLNCKKSIEKGATCGDCKSNEIFIYNKIIGEKNQYINKLKDLNLKCKKCQGEDLEQIPCSNDDCDLFYKKFQLKKHIENKKVILERFK
jgi:DNA polymerase delta subunit 1